METVKITVKEAVNAYEALDSICNQVVGVQQDGKPIYKKYQLGILWPLEDIKDALEKTYERNREQVIELAKKFGEPHPQQFGRYQVKNEHMPEYSKELEKLNSAEVSVSFVPVFYETLVDFDVSMNGSEAKPLRKHFIKKGGDVSGDKKPRKSEE